MQIVVIPDRRSPVVTHMVWYRTGSSEDPIGKSGIAHFLEHLMFKGTAMHPAGHFGKILAGVGGQENAFTSHDVTAYHQRVPKQNLATCMAYEADRMRNLVLDDATVASERDVVLAERGMILDSKPASLLQEALEAAAFPAHPSGRPVIGWRHEIETLGREDALAYYRRYYAPQNAILVVAGDAEPQAVLEMAEAAYGAIPPSDAPPERRRVQDPPARMHRQITLADTQVHQPQLMRLHAVPSYISGAPGEAEALEMLAFLLAGDPTSVLHTRLVQERKCATSVGISYWDTAIDRSRFLITATPAPDVSPETLEHTLEDVLRDLLKTGFEADAIKRAKTQLVASALYALDSQVSLANWYGMALACGMTLEDIAAWPVRIEAVTAEHLHDALLKLDRRSAVSGYLLEAAAAA
ncbi:insulinase family protein [Methylobacterium sp. BTF04]|nr:insulinase family protein [Methylobacterium sp. BTF04]